MMNSDIKKAIPVQWLLDNGVLITLNDRITDGEANTRYNLDPRYKDWSVFEFAPRSYSGNNKTTWKPNFKKLYYQYSAEVLEVKAQQERVKAKKEQRIKDEIYKIVDCNISLGNPIESIFNLFNPSVADCLYIPNRFNFDIEKSAFKLGIQMRFMKLNNQIKTLESLYDAKEINHYSFKRNSDFYREVFSNDIYKIRPGGDV